MTDGMDGWLPMAGAPRDGTAFRARLNNGDVETIRWDGELWASVSQQEFFVDKALVGWKPLEVG